MTDRSDRLTNKRSGPNAPGVAFVTGGARGLGNAIAISLARKGARAVAIVDIQDEATLENGKSNVELNYHSVNAKEEFVLRCIIRVGAHCEAGRRTRTRQVFFLLHTSHPTSSATSLE